MVRGVTWSAAIAVLSLILLAACANDNSIESTDNPPQSIRIAAAANLSDVLPQIIKSYEANLVAKALPKQNIDVTYASSGKLYAQIIADAPYDIFLSANQDFPATLAKDDANYLAPFTYTQGQLAVYSTTQSIDNLNSKTLAELLSAQSATKVAIANPELAPYGASATAYLQSQNLYKTLITQKRLIQAENIGQAFQYVHTGSVDYGFVAQSQLIAIDADAKQFYTLPASSYPAIMQDGIVLSHVSAATEFANYLQSDNAQREFSQAGYLAVQ